MNTTIAETHFGVLLPFKQVSLRRLTEHSDWQAGDRKENETFGERTGFPAPPLFFHDDPAVERLQWEEKLLLGMMRLKGTTGKGCHGNCLFPQDNHLSSRQNCFFQKLASGLALAEDYVL